MEAIIELFHKNGQKNYIGEMITQTEHALQTAILAEKDRQEDYVIIGALLHDIGHLLDGENMYTDGLNLGVKNHEKIGADYLRNMGFDAKICKLVEKHVDTKRYLLYKQPNRKLSEASQKTLAHQGGIMTEDEANLFEKDKLFQKYIKIREYDDRAKVVGMDVPSLRDFLEKMLKK